MISTNLMVAALVAAGLTGAPTELQHSPGGWVDCAIATNDAACAHLERADALMKEFRVRAARREYERAVRARNAAGQYAGEELWRLAAFRLHNGAPRRAARTLDLLAREAQEVGDVSRHAKALIEAAYIYHQLGDRSEVEARVGRLMAILESPYLPDPTRSAIRDRLVV